MKKLTPKTNLNFRTFGACFEIMASRNARRRPVSSSASQEPPATKRQHSKVANGDDLSPNKRAKVNGSAITNTKEERLVDIRTKFNLAINELFQLQEYKSLADWKPTDFSVPFLSNHIPELYESFLAEPKHKLEWDEEIETSQNLNDLPLRLQKKVKAEIETKLQQKYPFKDEVIQKSDARERELIEASLQAQEPVVQNAKKLKKVSEKTDIKSENEDSESLLPTPETHYKVKQVKYSIPPPKVTHPSHIPQWLPQSTNGDTISGSEKTIYDFSPNPIEILNRNGVTTMSPDIQLKLRSFLQDSYKAAIIDESVMPDYNNTPEEYERVMLQQEAMLKSIRRKINDENSMQLNGDKIELRKVVLPQTNTTLSSDPYRNTGTVLPKIQGARNNLTFHDHFLTQAASFAKIHQQMRRQHQLRTKKIALMIEQHFKKKMGEKDRLAREQEQNLRRISRLAIQAVKRRWTQAQKVYSYIQQQKEDEIKQIKGREHLTQMLQHSTQLLEAQLSGSMRNKSDSNSSSGQSDSDDYLSSDDSEEEGINEGDDSTKPDAPDSNDQNLSVEVLREKYANMNGSSGLSPSNSAGKVSDDEKPIVPNNEASAESDNADTQSLPVTEYTEEQKKFISENNEEELPQALLDSASSSESLLEESESSDEDSASEEADPSERKIGTGLSSLFSKDLSETGADGSESEASSDFKVEDDSDDDDIMSETGDEKDEPADPAESSADDGEEIINGAKVKDVPVPSLLRGTLRPYQKQGLNWLASLYNNNTNGILADEMGLGKTIQTISLLAYLACEHHVWGPHLIIVPTSVMLNWEMEFKKFAPGFKVLTYYGSPQQRAMKRKGWNKPDAFHVCITSYQLVVHDHQSFKRRRWRYMILDEAHNIKNFRSARWKALLNFNTENRLLLTGTPLQNNVMELWSLLYFLMPSSKLKHAMPSGFADLDNFQQWFGRPVDKILEQTTAGSSLDIVGDDDRTTQMLDRETKNTVARLHQVLRPYLLRRLKKDVEQQMPGKYEHIVYCRLSKRQRFLYDDFMSRAKTKETLASGNFLSIINCLMQLRKVCNHPDLFEVRPVVTSFAMPKAVANVMLSANSLIRKELDAKSPFEKLDLNLLNLDVTNADEMNYFVSQSASALKFTPGLSDSINKLDDVLKQSSQFLEPTLENSVDYYKYLKTRKQMDYKEKLEHVLYLNTLRCNRSPIYGESLLRFLTSKKPVPTTDIFQSFQISIPKRVSEMSDVIDNFSVLTPPVVAIDMKDQLIPISTQRTIMEKVNQNVIENPFIKSQVKLSIGFPDKSLLQYDCGKLQKLASLLQNLIANGHRALIFTQMTKVLDILEQFLNIHGYRYMRLDGATKIDDRQLMTERFNRDPKIPVFILSTRSGGLGINLTGADTVIFYDSDWNPAMDKQCQDRCHRIGQIRDVHIYRFVSEYTIESNILKKANQKRQLYNVVIQEGEFTTDYFGKFSVKDLVDDVGNNEIPDKILDFGGDSNLLAQAEDEDDRAAATEAMKEVAIDDEDFDDENKTSASNTPGQTPIPKSETPRSPSVSRDTPVPNGKQLEQNVDIDFEEGIGHIDEYMLRFISDGYYGD